MVEFMRNAARDVSYCASKCVAGRDEIKEWSEERFNDVLQSRVEDAEESCGKFRVMVSGAWQVRDVAEAVHGIVCSYEEYSHRFDAEKAMYESGLWDGGDMPSCEVYTMRFLWCMHAMRWFVARVPPLSPSPVPAHPGIPVAF